MSDAPEVLRISTIHEVVPEYESDLNAVGDNRSAEDPDPRPWYEVHGLTEAEAEAHTVEAHTDPEAGR